MQRLLIVEDDADISAAFTALFSHPHISLEVATNGIQAVARARELRPHVILMDVGLPAMDGFDVFLALRRDPSLSATRVIFVSAMAPSGALELARQFGAYACLKKPISGDILVERVHAALGIPVPIGCAGTGRKIGRRLREGEITRSPQEIARTMAETAELEPLPADGGACAMRPRAAG